MADDGGTPELKPALPDPECGGGGGGFVLVADCDDIIADILARLPAKSLMRFRCVCKPWRALISDPYFVKKHAKKGGMKKLLFAMDPPQTLNYDALKNLDLEKEVDDEFAITELDFQARIPAYLVKTIVILGSLNGLVCVLVDFMGIVIWNPSTGETSKFLPHPPCELIKLSFYGFGYDSTTNDYKIVVGRGNGCPFKAHIFALKTGSWKILPKLNDGDYAYIFGHGYFLNGALHWFMKSSMLRPSIVSFSLERERFEEVPLPSCYSGNWFSNLLIFRSCICLVKEDSPKYLSVWTMNEYGVAESWTLQFSVYTDPGLDLTPICILENGVILMQKSSCDEFGTKRNIILLMNKTTSKTVFEVAGDMRFGSGIYRVSLVSVRSIAGLQN